jgi:hypothetical protein
MLRERLAAWTLEANVPVIELFGMAIIFLVVVTKGRTSKKK